MRKLILIGLLFGLLVTAGCSSNEPDVNAAGEDATVELRNTIDAFGIVKSNDVKEVFIDFTAAIEEVHIKDGQKVKKGDKLFTLNLDEYKNQISSKEIELSQLLLEQKSSDMELTKLRKDLNTLTSYLASNTDPDLKKLLNDFSSAKKVYEKSLEELNTKKLLFKNGSISEAELDTYQQTVDANKKSVDDINSSIERTKNNLQKEIDQINLKINQKTASSEEYDANTLYDQRIAALKNTLNIMKEKIGRSYIDGNNIIADMENAIVYDLGYVKGESVNPAKKLMSIMNTDLIIIEANVPEEFIKDVKAGAEVTVIPQADKSRKYKGKITYMSNKAVQANGETTVLIHTSVDNTDKFLLPYFNVSLEIEI